MDTLGVVSKLTSGLALVGFVAALVAQVARLRVRTHRHALDRAPPQEVPRLASDAVAMFRLPVERLPPDRVAALAMKELRLREQRAQPRFRLLLLGAVLSAALAGLSVLVPPWRGAPAPPAPAPTPPPPVAPPVSAAPSIPSDPGPWSGGAGPAVGSIPPRVGSSTVGQRPAGGAWTGMQKGHRNHSGAPVTVRIDQGSGSRVGDVVIRQDGS